ncbi:DUF3515 domain-containing protein [Rhodococcus rhodnii]|uniref:DUF3515 domain-containing protein n=1 Tax=Rhodococcus rhodnii TaxID=38312 RepID=A0A6P2CDI6_9NOCA|nr:DUF3515 domain-containing protein [Rhodococcus rhodnii]TXG90799.1 DUF3515 domain-containing protein [Rhodococcus rhodnii]
MRSPAVLATAVALPVAVIVAVIVSALLAGRSADPEPVSLGPVPAPESGSPQCASLLDALPEAVGDFERASLVEPAPEATAAWRVVTFDDEPNEPIVLRCGVDRPLEFDQASALQIVDDVQWFEVSGESIGLESSSWFAVDRGIYVGVTIPNGSGPTPLQVFSEVMADTLPPAPIDPAPIPVPGN